MPGNLAIETAKRLVASSTVTLEHTPGFTFQEDGVVFMPRTRHSWQDASGSQWAGQLVHLNGNKGYHLEVEDPSKEFTETSIVTFPVHEPNGLPYLYYERFIGERAIDIIEGIDGLPKHEGVLRRLHQGATPYTPRLFVIKNS